MARIIGLPESFYRATELFVDRSLRSGRSLFDPDRKVWTAAVTADLFDRFADQYDLSSDSFMTKWKRQLSGSSADTIQLAAELIYIHVIVAEDFHFETKRDLVDEVLSWDSGTAAMPDDLLDALHKGIASTGVGYKTHRDAQLRFLVRFAQAWADQPSDARDASLADPWVFKEFAEEVSAQGAAQQKNALLYVVFPDTFEPTLSVAHKQQMIEQFGQDGDPGDVDRRLLAIRERLTPEHGEDFSFYEPPLRSEWLDKPPADLAASFEAVLTAIQARSEGDQETLRGLVVRDLPKTLQGQLPDGYTAKGSVGQGTASLVPWVGVFPPGTDSAQLDYYLVYLFAATGERVYLSLIQGTDKVRGGLPPLIKRSLDLRAAAGDAPDLLTEIDLASTVQRPRRYQAATAYAAVYEAEAVPDTADLGRDLYRFKGLLDTAVESGLQFDPEIEPLHLLLKWSSEQNTATVENHRAVAEQRGSVWWGAFRSAESPAPMSTETLSTLRDQLKRGMPTHAYLYGGGELWKCRLEEITLEEADVDEARLPSDYSKADCRLFTRLSHFDQVPVETATEQLVLARNPAPASIGPTLSNQTTPMLVYELFRPITGPEVLPPEQFDLEWLLRRTLWQGEPLEELIHAARETSPQIVLAGPPGTGKTWVAQALVRHLTGGSPMAHEVVQFHPSYGYEEFIEGIRPTVTNGHIEFERVDGIVLRIVKSLSQVGGDFYLIIDEMNRANLSRVFGELMYLFEYRDQPINLRYTPAFELPPNLKFIGTMNTADRSIRSIDIALRRRFDVFECAPDRGILERYYQNRPNDIPSLFDGFDSLNAELERRLDRHHTIGQTFFMRNEGMTAQWLRQVWSRKLAPLIEEYFFDQPDVVEQFTPQVFWSELDGSSTDAD